MVLVSYWVQKTTKNFSTRGKQQKREKSTQPADLDCPVPFGLCLLDDSLFATMLVISGAEGSYPGTIPHR